LTDSLEKDQAAGFAASRILYHDNPEMIDRAGDSYSNAGAGILRGRGSKATDYGQSQYIFGACAAAAMYRKAMIDQVGFLDPEFFLIYEDVDLSFRAQLSGYQCLYVPSAMVYHKVSSSIIRDSPVSVYYGHRNLEWVYFQNMPSRLLLRSLWSHAAYDLAAFFYFTGKGLTKPFLRAKWHAIRSFKRIMKNRKQIQSKKRVVDAYLWRLMEKERFLPRLAMRIAKK
jgi:GT2 family glycosyltransferase